MGDKNQAVVQTPQENKADEQKPFKAGEKGFAIFWLLFGGFFLYQSILMYREHPGLNSCAALPLFVSSVIVACALIILLIDRKAPSASHGKSVSEVVRATLRTLVPVDVLVMLVLMSAYCILLYLGAGFYVATPLFLFLGMMFFMRKQYIVGGKIDKKAMGKAAVKNLIWTVLALLFILVVFTYLFRVVLP